MFGDGVDSNANMALNAALRATVTNYLNVLALCGVLQSEYNYIHRL